jgi:hypothetical protein
MDGQSFSLKRECIPTNVDSVSLIIYKGIRGKRIRNSKYSKPIKITDIEMRFYFANSFLIDSIYSKMWDSLKVSKSNVNLLQVGVDSLFATYIEEQKINKNGIKNSELGLIKSGAVQNYLCFRYRRDD